MRFVRLYSEGTESRFEDGQLDMTAVELVPDAPPAGVSAGLPVDRARIVSYPPGWFSDQTPSPGRQFLLVLAGVLDIEAGDGDVRRFGPGSILLVEDTSGSGHRTRVVGMGPAVVAVLDTRRHPPREHPDGTDH